MDAEKFDNSSFPDGALTLVCVRKKQPSTVLEGLLENTGALLVQSNTSHSYLWFKSAHMAIAVAHRIVVADQSRLSAGVSTGDTSSGDGVRRLVDEAVGAANLTEAGQIFVALSTQELTRTELKEDLTFEVIGPKELESGLKSMLFILSNLDSVRETVGAEQVKRWDPNHFVGRDQEIVDILARFETFRFVCLIGPSGIGKTTLAARIAAEFEDVDREPVVWVELEEVYRPSLMLHKLASVLEISALQEDTLLGQIARKIGQQDRLVVLDGVDSLSEAVAELAETLLNLCPNVSILTTSKNRIASSFADALVISGLEYPEPFERIERFREYDAVRLLQSASRRVGSEIELDNRSLRDIAYILNAIEGSPWAIQIIAGRLQTLSPALILNRLKDDPLAFLVDKNDSNRTMYAVLAAAVSTLNPWSETLFRRLWVFAGSFDSKALEQVCVDAKLPRQAVLDSMKDLLDAHLITRSRKGASRRAFRLNQITREYSRSSCSKTERSALQKKLGEYLDRKKWEFWPQGLSSDAESLEEFDFCYEDLRSSWLKQSENSRSATAAVDGALIASNFWLQKGYHAEGLSVVAQLVQAPAVRKLPKYATLLNVGAWCALALGDFAMSLELARAALKVAIERGSEEDQAKILNTASALFDNADRPKLAYRSAKAALRLFERLGRPANVNIVKSNLAGILVNLGRLEEAATIFDEVLKLNGDQKNWAAVTLHGNIASLEAERGDYEACARELFISYEIAEQFPYRDVLPTQYLTACTMCLGQRRFWDLSVLVEAIHAMLDFYGLSLSIRRKKLLEKFELAAGRGMPIEGDVWQSHDPYRLLLEAIK